VLKLPFRAATLTRLGGDEIVTPLLDPSVLWVGASAREMADHFAKAARDKLIDRASPVALLPAAGPLTFEARRIDVSVPESADGHLHPAMQFRFDTLLSPLPVKGWIGFVPALGIEAIGSTADDCIAHLRESVTIEFARKKRRLSTHALLATQWFTGLELVEREIELPVHTMQDLKDIARQKLRRLLPEIATELKPSQPRAFGMDAELDALARALSGRYTRSVLLVGPSGSGKTSLVEEFARTASPKKIWDVTAGRLIQKLTRGSGWQENLAVVVRELRETGEFLFVRNYAGLFEVGQYAGNSLSIADALRAPIERGEITILSECTPEQAARIDVRAPGSTAMFHVIRVEEPAGATLESIVARRAPTASPDAVREAIRLQKRYRPYSGFPGKTIRFLDALSQKTAAPSFAPEGGATEGRRITRDSVIQRFCEEAGMPEFMVDPAKPLPLETMERHFVTNVFGQEEATTTVVDLLASVKAGLARGGKPIATLLFIGPTGVGKTELAKVLAEFMFGSRSRMIRFDMSEYADAISCLRLTGDAGTDGLLTGAVREEPFSVILFDEVEKAHPVFFDLLLQVLGEGRLTDAGGRVADFCSTIVIMTSNLGASELPKGTAGFAAADGRRRQVLDHFKAAVEAHFRPELFNRLDRVVAFAPLSQEMIRRIVDREVGLLRLRPGLRYRDVSLSITPAALDRLGQLGTDSLYGARQLQRTIRDLVALPLAQQLNRYEMATSIEAVVDDVDGTIDARMKGVAKKETGETSMRMISLQVTGQRRRLEDVVEGTVLAKVASDIELLERRRRKAKEKAWIQSHEARQLERYTKLKRDCEAAYADVEFLEAEAVLSLVESDHASADDLRVLLADHRDRSWKACRALFTLNADSGAAIVGIYGNAKHLDFLSRIYTRIAKHQELDVAPYRVWHAPSTGSVEARPAQGPPPAKDAILVGMELRLAGSGASLLFSEEDGLHRLRDREGEWHSYVLLSAGGAWAPFDDKGRPEGVHRRAFFDRKQPRRTILPDSVEDRNHGWSVKTEDYPKALFDAINRQFEEKVYRALR